MGLQNMYKESVIMKSKRKTLLKKKKGLRQGLQKNLKKAMEKQMK